MSLLTYLAIDSGYLLGPQLRLSSRIPTRGLSLLTAVFAWSPQSFKMVTPQEVVFHSYVINYSKCTGSKQHLHFTIL